MFATELESWQPGASGMRVPVPRLRWCVTGLSAGHLDCALRRHLDSVPPDTPIRDIVDWCRVWESHLDTHVGYQRLPTVTDNNRESSTISGGFLKVAEEVGKTTTDSGLPDQ